MQTRNAIRFVLILIAAASFILASVGVVMATGNLLSNSRGYRLHIHPGKVVPEWMQTFRDILNRDTLLANTASALDLSLADLQTAQEDGTLWELLTEQGIDDQTLKEALQNARDQILADAVASGTITQDDVDTFIAWQQDHGGRGHGHGHGRLDSIDPDLQQRLKDMLDRDILLATIATRLGIPATDLQAAKEGGTLRDLLTEHEVDNQTLKEAAENARDQILADAVANGTITQDEADLLQSRRSGGFKRHGHGSGWFRSRH